VSTELPTGEIIPRPVTTTRRWFFIADTALGLAQELTLGF
jgi:hypothetical protein